MIENCLVCVLCLLRLSFHSLWLKKKNKTVQQANTRVDSVLQYFCYWIRNERNYLVHRNIWDVIRSSLNNSKFIFQKRNDSQLKNYAVCIQAILLYTQWWFHIIRLINSEVVFRRIFFFFQRLYIDWQHVLIVSIQYWNTITSLAFIQGFCLAVQKWSKNSKNVTESDQPVSVPMDAWSHEFRLLKHFLYFIICGLNYWWLGRRHGDILSEQFLANSHKDDVQQIAKSGNTKLWFDIV